MLTQKLGQYFPTFIRNWWEQLDQEQRITVILCSILTPPTLADLGLIFYISLT